MTDCRVKLGRTNPTEKVEADHVFINKTAIKSVSDCKIFSHFSNINDHNSITWTYNQSYSIVIPDIRTEEVKSFHQFHWNNIQFYEAYMSRLRIALSKTFYAVLNPSYNELYLVVEKINV